MGRLWYIKENRVKNVYNGKNNIVQFNVIRKRKNVIDINNYEIIIREIE